jgi:hypothetical protein
VSASSEQTFANVVYRQNLPNIRVLLRKGAAAADSNPVLVSAARAFGQTFEQRPLAVG